MLPSSTTQQRANQSSAARPRPSAPSADALFLLLLAAPLLALALAGGAARADEPPARVDLAPRFAQWGLPPVEQGRRDTCSLFAITAVANFEWARGGEARFAEGADPAADPGPDRADATRLSEEFLTWAANDATGLRGDQAMFYEALAGLNARGLCPADLMPYAAASDAARVPSPRALESARALADRWRVRWIKRWSLKSGLSDAELREVQAALAANHPVACGLRWPKHARSHELPEVEPAEVFDGHSIVFVGYEDDAARPGGGRLWFRNSAGPTWGRAGHGAMSYQYARRYANDALWLELGPPGAETPIERHEAENLAIAKHERCPAVPQDMRGWGRMWSGDRQLFCPAAEGGWVELVFAVTKPGRRRVRVLATAAPDFGRVRVALDDHAAAGPFDLYSGRVSPAGSLELGAFDLAAGEHRLRFSAAGKHEHAAGHFFGVDAIDLLPAP